MLRRVFVAAVAAFLPCVAMPIGPAKAGDQAAEILLNQYSIYRASPTAQYFTPGSLIMGWSYKGVLRLEMVCRNKIDINQDPDLLKASLEQGGFSATSGFQFDVGLTAVNVLNAAFGRNFVNSVTMKVENPTVYEYAAEDLREIRAKLLKRPGCAQALSHPREERHDGGVVSEPALRDRHDQL